MTLATDDTRLPSLFSHSTRKDWGVGVLAWEDGGKRGYLFEDGEERTMASGFYQLMRKVEQPTADQKAASLRLQRVLAARATASSALGVTGPSFSDQLARFHDAYPAGLQDPKWIEEVRGEGAAQLTSRHRAAPVREAHEQLSAAALDALLGSQRFEQVCDIVVRLLGLTDLVPTAQLRKPKSMTPERQRDLAVAARELLYGKLPYEQRFDRYVAALGAYTGEPARWEIATALSALVLPAEHICVHPSVFRLQLKAMGSRATAAVRPTGAAYARLLVVTRAIAKKLTDHGEAPRDFLDVHDFIRTTLKPVAKPRAATLRGKTRSVAPAAIEPEQAEAETAEGDDEEETD